MRADDTRHWSSSDGPLLARLTCKATKANASQRANVDVDPTHHGGEGNREEQNAS